MSRQRTTPRALADAREALAMKHHPVPLVAEDDEQAAMEQAFLVARDEVARAKWEAACPARFRDVTWDWVVAEHGKDVAERIHGWSCDDEGANLLLFGPVGTGKTAAALLACKDGLLDRNLGVIFAPVAELLDHLRPSGPDPDYLRRVTIAPRLIVDDLGSERPTEWTAERLDIVINRRWLERRPTVATTNLEPDALRAAIGERSYSRLVESAVALTLSGNDRRRAKP